MTPDVAADYADVIKTPMSFQDILEKLARHEYSTIDEVEVIYCRQAKHKSVIHKVTIGRYNANMEEQHDI